MHEYILDSDQTSSDLVYAVAVVTKRPPGAIKTSCL